MEELNTITMQKNRETLSTVKKTGPATDLRMSCNVKASL